MQGGGFGFGASPARSPMHASSARAVFASDFPALLEQSPSLKIIDIRESTDYARAHIPTAINIPMPDFATLSSHILRHPETPYMLYCYSGYTASVYGTQLVAMGAENVCFFDESFEALMHACADPKTLQTLQNLQNPQ